MIISAFLKVKTILIFTIIFKISFCQTYSGQNINFENGDRILPPRNPNNFQPTFPGSGNFNSFEELTIECWILWNGGSSFPYGIFEGRTLGWQAGSNNGVSSGIHLELRPSSSGSGAAVRWGINRGGAFSEPGGLFLAENVVFPNQWTHIAVTYNDNTSSLKIYINGILKNERIQNQGTTRNFDEYSAIGTSCCTNSNPQERAFRGKIEEFRIWFTERSLEEIRNTMCIKPDVTDNNLVLYYDFDGIFNTNQIEDKSMYNNHGNLNGLNINDFNPSLAPLGNYSSFNYDMIEISNNGFIYSHLNSDSLSIQTTSSNLAGVHIYSLNNIQDDTLGIFAKGSNQHYYGTFIITNDGQPLDNCIQPSNYITLPID
jgi:hypothetical protein